MTASLQRIPSTHNEAFQFALLQQLKSLSPSQQEVFAFGTIDATVNFAKRLDAEHYRRSRSRRWAEVFQRVIGNIDGFFKVISTAIQARPEIAAFVWGGMRFIMEVVSHYAALYDKISSALESVSNDLAYYHEYATVLYGNWDQVQEALVDVYGDIINMCAAVFRTFKLPNGRDRSSWRILGLALNPFSRRFDEIISSLQRHRQIIDRRTAHVDRLEVRKQWALAERNCTMVDEERGRQDGEREAARVARANVEQRWRDQQLDKFLDSLKPASYEFMHQRLKRYALAGTGQWFLQSAVFAEWSASGGSCGMILWCRGGAGTGKTILTSIIVDWLRDTSTQSGKTAVAHFYCDFRDPDYRTPEIVLQSLLDQLVRQLDPDSPALSEIIQWHPHTLSARARDTQGVINSILPDFEQVYIVVDGLDECLELNVLLPVLETLGQRCRLLVTSRPRDDIARRLGRYSQIHMTRESTSNDIRAFVHSQIRERVQSQRLHVRDERVIEEVSRTLVDQADGMFLWVALQLDYVCEQHTDYDIRTALRELPRGLEETYMRSLRQIDALPARRAQRCRRVLGWIAGARDRLFLDELAEAVAMEDMDQGYWQKDRISNHPMSLIEDCAHLCAVGHTIFNRIRVQLTHASVRDFLCATDPTKIPRSLPTYHMRLPMLHLRLAELCISRARLGSRYESAERFAFLRRWPYSLAPPETCAAEWHIAAAGKDESLNDDEWLHLMTVFRNFVDTYPFHLEGEIALHIAVRIRYGGLRLTRTLLESGADVHAKDDRGSTPLHLAAASKSSEASEIIRLLVNHGGDVNSTDCAELMPIHRAAGHRTQDMYLPGAIRLQRAAGGVSLEVCSILLKLGANARAVSECGSTPMHDAAGSGSPEAAAILCLLAKHGGEVSVRDAQGSTPLHRAAERSSLEACSALLSMSADAKAINHAGATPLHFVASSVPNPATPVAKVINMLVQHGADVNARDEMGYTPVHRAAKNGSPRASAALLKCWHADPCASANDGVTPLHLAAGCRSEHSIEIAALLMERCQSVVHKIDDFGNTPLHRAAMSGSVDMVSLLLACGANVRAANHTGAEPLHYATQTGLKVPADVIELLVRRGACLAAQTRAGETAIHWAARATSLEACTKLLECGADSFALNDEGDAAIHILADSCEGDAGKLVALLANHGVNVNSFNKQGTTPLHRAAERGGLVSCFGLLLHGASPQLVDREGRTPLHAAAVRTVDATSVINLLVNRGADVEHRTVADQTTPLHMAAAHGSFKACRALLRRRANARAVTQSGATPMHLVAERVPHSSDSARTIDILAQFGGDVAAEDQGRRTPLHLAAQAVNPSVCSVLLPLGADPTKKDAEWRTPLHFLAEAIATECGVQSPNKLLSPKNMVAFRVLYTAAPWSLATPDHKRLMPRLLVREAALRDPQLSNILMRLWYAEPGLCRDRTMLPEGDVPQQRRARKLSRESAESVFARKRSASAPPWHWHSTPAMVRLS